jgi:hypothetical protein
MRFVYIILYIYIYIDTYTYAYSSCTHNIVDLYVANLKRLTELRDRADISRIIERSKQFSCSYIIFKLINLC